MPKTPHTDEISKPVLAEGLWLGAAYLIASMRYLETWGWVARDTTGAEYVEPVYRLADLTGSSEGADRG